MEIYLTNRYFIECDDWPPTEDNNIRFDVFTAVTMKNTVFWNMGRCVVLVRTNVSEEHIVSIFMTARMYLMRRLN
jgi:hypothetical protein